MKRTAFLILLAFAGCRNDSGSTSSHGSDMSAGGGGTSGDMAASAPAQASTIAAARMGKVTTAITVTAVVTAVHSDEEWYVEDQAGGKWSGIDVFCNKSAKTKPCPMSIATPSVNDLVQITGVITSYNNVKAELTPSAQTTMMKGATPPPLLMIDSVDAAEMQSKPELRGVLLKLNSGTWTVDNVMPSALEYVCKTDGGCTPCMPPQYAGFEVSDGTNKLYVYNYFYMSSHLTSSPECLSAAMAQYRVSPTSVFSALGGILDVDPYAAGNPVVLAPTSDNDYMFH